MIPSTMGVETDNYTTITALLMGIGLAAACGFRVFVPLLIASLAIRSGVIPADYIDASFQWLGSDAAIIVFASATVLEVLAYYIPLVDNALDAVTAPAALVAGTLLTVAFIPDISPVYKWGLAIIAGGGAASVLKGGSTIARGGSTVSTAGLANPIVSTIELAVALVISLLAIVLPLFCILLLLLLFIFCLRLILRFIFRRKAKEAV